MTDVNLLFENEITREGLKAIFNPYSIMTRINDHFFIQETLDELEKNVSYEDLKILPFYTTCFEKDKEKLFEEAIKTYLSFSDGMPFFPTKEDWMKKISAPEDFIKKIIPENCVDLSSIIGCDLFCPELEIIFRKKIRKMEKLEEDNYDEGKFEFSDWYFEEYTSNHVSETIKKQWEKYLSKEFEVARRLHDAWENKEYFYAIAKEKNLSVNEALMLFIDYAFEVYDELIS